MKQLASLIILGLFALVPAFAADDYTAEIWEIDQDQQVGDTEPPMLGVQMSPPSRRVLEREGLDADTGIYVHRVYDDTAASQLGVERGDVITAINGEPIGSMTDLRTLVLGAQVGDGVEVTVRRDGQDVNLSGGSYQPWPEHIPYRELDPAAEQRYRDLQRRRLGQQLRNLDRLVEQNDDLEQDLADLENFKGLEDGLGVGDLFAPMSELPRMPDGTMPTMIPAELLALGGWKFQYGFAAQDSDALKLKFEDKDIKDVPVAQPTAGLTFQLDVSSEYY